jgi:hypothetical protein
VFFLPGYATNLRSAIRHLDNTVPGITAGSLNARLAAKSLVEKKRIFLL